MSDKTFSLILSSAGVGSGILALADIRVAIEEAAAPVA